ncbi:MAG: trypsin-like serine protease, partial [Acholeplasmataceae bacterium]|nr:trypsin-like serine protease [Acholeplasmataceae bacterium]
LGYLPGIFLGENRRDEKLKVESTEDEIITLDEIEGEPILVDDESGFPAFDDVQVDDETARYIEILELKKLAENGDTDAQVKLGIKYYTGDGVTKDYAEAARWYQKAAAKTNSTALFNLGFLYAFGQGVPKNQELAAKFMRQAADQGDATMQLMLGRLFYKSNVLPLDHAEAAYWFNEAAQQGHLDAQRLLGYMYMFGQGVQVDYIKAYSLLKVPAEQGDMFSQMFLGRMYYFGGGVEKNYAEAARWYRKAAEQGNIWAQSFLGLMYYSGEGVEKNYAEAARWFRKAADQGDADSQGMLGDMYYNGHGFVKNPKQAYIWALIASARGVEETMQEALNTLLELCENDPYLTANDIREAREIASQWKPAPITGQQSPDSEPFQPFLQDKDRSELEISATGSGFVISADGYFLTCAHVVEGARTVKVRIGEKTHASKIVCVDGNNDVALLKIEGSDFSPLPLAGIPPEMGDKVFTVGYPNLQIQGSAPKYTEGVVSALSGIRDDIRMMQITVPIQGGNSGGVLADANGSAVGLVMSQLNAINVFKYTGNIPQNVNFAVKISYAQPLIQSVPGLSRRLRQQAGLLTKSNPVKAVEAATGLVIIYE